MAETRKAGRLSPAGQSIASKTSEGDRYARALMAAMACLPVTGVGRRRPGGNVARLSGRVQSCGGRREGGYGLSSRTPLSICWSGRPDSNRRRPAWEAGILPLNYGRPATPILQLLQRSSPPLFPVLERHGIGLEHLVAARLPGETLAHAVEVDLLVEGHRRQLVDPELVDPVVLLQALLLVHDGLGFVEHPVEVLVVPVDEDARRLEEGAVHSLGVHRAGAPADQPDRSRLGHIHHAVQIGHAVGGAETR